MATQKKKTTRKKATTTKKVVGKRKVAKKVTKKVAKSNAAKATAVKKKKSLVKASDEQCFWVHDGPVLESLIDLRDQLSDMDDTIYLYHAEGPQNDFAEWVEYCLLDKACANALRKAKQKKTALSAVKKRLTIYRI